MTTTESNTSLAKYLQPITKECNELLQEPQHKQFKPAGQILNAVGTATTVSFYLVIKNVFPSLLTVYQAADSTASIRALLEIFTQIFDAAIVVYDSSLTKGSDLEIENPISLFKDRLFEMISKALMSTSKDEVSLRIAAIRGLLRLCQIRALLEKGEVGLFIQYCQEIYLEQEAYDRDDLGDQAIKALVDLSTLYPQQAMEMTVPAFISRLPDSCKDESLRFLVPLQGLAQLGIQDQLFGLIVRRLLSRLDLVIQYQPNQATSALYPEAILMTLSYLFKRRKLSHDPNLGEYVEKIVHNLVGRVALGASDTSQATILNNSKCMEALGRLAGAVVHSLDEHKQKAIGLRVYALEDAHFVPVPFRANASEPERLTLVISTHLLAAARPLVSLSISLRTYR